MHPANHYLSLRVGSSYSMKSSKETGSGLPLLKKQSVSFFIRHVSPVEKYSCM
jgi:hypothetical protein